MLSDWRVIYEICRGMEWREIGGIFFSEGFACDKS